MLLGFTFAIQEVFLLQRAIVVFLVSVFLLLAAAGCADSKKRAKSHYLQGKTYEKEGKLQKAIEEYRNAMRLYPGYIQAHLDYQRLMLAKGQKKTLIDFYEKQVRDNPRNPTSYYLYGRLLDDSPSRIEQFEKALTLDPNFIWGYDSLGMEYLKQGKVDGAIKQFMKVIEIDSEFPRVHINLCRAYLIKNKPDRAYSEIKKFLELEPNSAEGYEQMGAVFHQKGDAEKALECWKKAREIDPRRIQPLTESALLLMERGDYDRAKEILKEAQRISPASPRVHYAMGSLLRLQRKTRESLEEMRLAQKGDPENTIILEALGELLLKMQVYDEAKSVFYRILSRNPRNTAALSGLAQISDAEGASDKAIAEYRSALSIDPDLLDARRKLAALLLKKRDNAAALAEYRIIALSEKAGSADHIALGLLYWERRDAGKTLREFLTASSGESPPEDLILTIGLMAEMKNLNAEAITFLHELSKASRDPAFAKECQGYSLVLSEKYEAAGIVLSQLLKRKEQAKSPASPSLCFELALTKYKAGDSGGAWSDIERCLSLISASDSCSAFLANCLRSRILGERGEREKALDDLKSLEPAASTPLLQAKLDYEMARIYGKEMKKRETLLYLEYSFRWGFRNPGLITGDKSFEFITKSDEFKKLSRDVSK
jgi:tetratricopeptide (TPR) repeat protein